MLFTLVSFSSSSQYDILLIGLNGKFDSFRYFEVAKLLISLLFKGPILTDAGSSFRIIKKKNLDEIIPRLKSNGPELQMELTTSLMINKAKILEKKVNYKKRKGKSNYTDNFYDSFKVLLVFTKIIILKFLRIF